MYSCVGVELGDLNVLSSTVPVFGRVNVLTAGCGAAERRAVKIEFSLAAVLRLSQFPFELRRLC